MERPRSTSADPPHAQAPDLLQRRSRRARAACELCRWKKVRCDTRGGHTCSNCAFENVRCVLVPKRPRKASNKSSVPRPSPRSFPAVVLDQPNVRRNVAHSQHNETDVRHQSHPVPAGSSPVGRAEELVDDSPGLEDPQIWTSKELDQILPPAQDVFDPPRHPTSRGVPVRHESSPGDLPDYIKPLPPTIDPEDIQYLRRKGAFGLTEPDLQEACLECYFQHVQPLFPIVDAAKITSIIKGTNLDNEKLSLLLLQALIFVGSTWVDVRLIRKLGFLSRNAFRRSIHRKMRLLYDADYENDRLCLIQTFVLWSFWFDGPNENKDAWHWIGVALSLSRIIGLHQASSEPNIDPAKDSQRKRLWWMLVTRDVLCSFALSRSPQIGEVDHNVAMLGMEDFDFHQLPDQLPGTVPPSIRQQRTFAQLSILFVRLMHIFGRICKVAYEESGSGKTAVLYSSQQLEGKDTINCKRKPSNMDQLKSYEKDLGEWRQGVPDELWHTSNIPSNPKGLERAELAHRGLLSMMYYTTMLNLHRPQMLPPGSVLNQIEPLQETTPDSSRGIVRFAARRITEIAMDFYAEDMIKSLSATCITCLILASITHIFDMTSDDQVIRFEAHNRLEQCKAIFYAFSEQQFGGQWALHVIGYIINRIERPKLQYKDLPTAKQAVISTAGNVVDGESDIPSSNTIDEYEIDHLRPTQPISSTGQRSTNNPVSDTRMFTSEINTMPAFSMLRQPFGNPDTLLPPLAMNQAIPDNLANFLGPDFAWLDFPNAPEATDYNWGDAPV